MASKNDFKGHRGVCSPYWKICCRNIFDCWRLMAQLGARSGWVWKLSFESAWLGICWNKAFLSKHLKNFSSTATTPWMLVVGCGNDFYFQNYFDFIFWIIMKKFNNINKGAPDRLFMKKFRKKCLTRLNLAENGILR